MEPALLSPDQLRADKVLCSRTIERLDEFLRAHVLLVDDQGREDSVMLKAITDYGDLPPCIQQRFSAFPVERLVRVRVEREAMPTIPLPTGSSEAIAIGVHVKADALFLTQQTMDALSSAGQTPPKGYTYDSYAGSVPYERERATRGGRALAGMSEQQFVDEIVGRVVYWARNVTLLDKMLAIASRDGGGNLAEFTRTVKLIHQVWSQGHYGGEGQFKIVVFCDATISAVSAHEQAVHVCQQLQLGTLPVRVSVKRLARNWRGSHDRYLLTNQQVVVGFSRGFDVVMHGGEMKPCDVFLRSLPSPNSDVVEGIMDADDIATVDWPVKGVRPKGFRNEAFDGLTKPSAI